jgi:hypothetical protein
VTGQALLYVSEKRPPARARRCLADVRMAVERRGVTAPPFGVYLSTLHLSHSPPPRSLSISISPVDGPTTCRGARLSTPRSNLRVSVQSAEQPVATPTTQPAAADRSYLDRGLDPHPPSEMSEKTDPICESLLNLQKCKDGLVCNKHINSYLAVLCCWVAVG